jgi:methyl-accepting chemotaxis protein
MNGRSLFFPLWFIWALSGGVLGVLSGYVSPWAAGPVSGLAFWILGALAFSRGRSEAFRSFREKVQSQGPSVKLSSLLEASAADPRPLETLALGVVEMDRNSSAPDPMAGKEAGASPSLEILETLESLVREQERTIQAFYAFRDVIRDWSTTIEKAGRINKSLLQLNEIIVSDSKKVAMDTDSAARSATEGIKTVGKEIKAMTEIKATIGSSAEVIQQLNLSSEQIGDFLATITSIARKTNLLALNAGIEAARAGEQGTGFAVVAGEIKILAEASAKAAGDVKHLVDDIRSKTTNAISLINTTGKIEENVNVVYSAGDVFMNIVKSIRKAGGLLGEISQALDDQRNDNELLVQLLAKIHSAGGQVRDKFEMAQQGLDQVQKLSQKIRDQITEARGTHPAQPGLS